MSARSRNQTLSSLIRKALRRREKAGAAAAFEVRRKKSVVVSLSPKCNAAKICTRRLESQRQETEKGGIYLSMEKDLSLFWWQHVRPARARRDKGESKK